VTTLSAPHSPPRSGVLIAIVVDCHWTPFSPQSGSFSETPKQIKLVVWQDSLVLGNLSRVKPCTLVPLPPWRVRLNRSRPLVETYRSLDSISQVYSLVKATIGRCVLVE